MGWYAYEEKWVGAAVRHEVKMGFVFPVAYGKWVISSHKIVWISFLHFLVVVFVVVIAGQVVVAVADRILPFSLGFRNLIAAFKIISGLHFQSQCVL